MTTRDTNTDTNAMSYSSKNRALRVRFAPSPTGFMHLGNVRSALMNFLLARQQQGSFILRLEDTDPQRIIDPQGKQIIADLHWLALTYDEGPNIGGPYAPYTQSERSTIYQEYLEYLKQQNYIYRCFCTAEELEKKRQRQIALKQAPRYDRTCAALSPAQEQELLKTTPFIWRFKITPRQITIHDMSRGSIHYDLSHFSDFPLTRQDGSFTFIFANLVDDITMNISHVIRGEDHLSNTALQAALYDAFNKPYPIFWHLPIIINKEGRKLSKRDFGFSLGDLRESGFLPEAINNYLTIIGASFEHEIMTMPELIGALNFNQLTSTGPIRYDLEKLRWVNHQWIMKLSPADLAQRCKNYITHAYSTAETLSSEMLEKLLTLVQPELVTLTDAVTALKAYFERPDLTALSEITLSPETPTFLENYIHFLEQHDLTNQEACEQALSYLIKQTKETGIPTKELYQLIRTALTGSPQGMGLKELFAFLPQQELITRLCLALGYITAKK